MAITLGNDPFNNDVRIDNKAQWQSTYIIGGKGVGKSTLLENMICQQIDAGDGLCVLDPHQDLINRIIERLPSNRFNDIILLDATNFDYPIGLNLFDCPDPTNPRLLQTSVEQVMHIFELLYDINRTNPMMQQTLRNATYTMIANGLTIAEVPFLLTTPTYRQKLVANVTSPQVRAYWLQFETKNKLDRDREIAATLNKLDEILQPIPLNIVGQAKTTINLRDIMDQKKLLLVKLDAAMPYLTSLVGSLIVSQILRAAYSRANLPQTKRKHFTLYADEFARFGTSEFKLILDEARKYGVSCVVGHQTRTQLSVTNRELANSVLQAGNKIVFRITSPDSEEMAGEFSTTPPNPKQEESGKRMKRTPVTDVIETLLSGKESSTNPVINNFAQKRLPLIYKDYLAALNDLFFDAMTGKPLNPSLNALFPILYLVHGDMGQLGKPYGFYYGILSYIPFPELQNMQNMYRDTISQLLFNLLSVPDGSWQQATILQQLNPPMRIVSRLIRLAYLGSWIQAAAGKSSCPQYEPWYNIDPNQISTKQEISPELFISIVADPGQEYKFYTEAALMQYIDQSLADETSVLLNVFTEIKQVMQALAKNPILGDSGEEEVVYRPGPQKTHNERKNEIANELSGLPNYVAKSRLAEYADTWQYCQHCKIQHYSNERYCGGCGLPLPAEYTLSIQKSNQGIPRKDLQARIDWITQQNVQQGYLKKRADVEAEILARQPLAPPPQPQPAPKPAKAPAAPIQQPVPVQVAAAPAQPRKKVLSPPAPQGKACPICSEQNPATAKFCNNCGLKL